MDSRMVESAFPEVGMVLMARVREIRENENRAFVNLVEYNNMRGLMDLSQNQEVVSWRIEPLVVDRIEPVMVESVDRGIATVRRNVTFAEYHACEGTYARRRFVHSVLSVVASRSGQQLQQVYSLLQWPTYESFQELPRSRSPFHGASRNLINRFRRLALLPWPRLVSISGLARSPITREWARSRLLKILRDTLELMVLFSFQIERPYLLAPTKYHENGWCWMVGLIRQMEALLKSNNILELHLFLSMQDMINQTPKDLLDEEGAAHQLETGVFALCHGSIVTDDICPLGGQRAPCPRHICPLSGQTVEVPHRAYFIRELTVVYDVDYDNWDGYIDEQVFNVAEGNRIPVAATVLWWPSYRHNDGTELYRPNERERERYANNPHSVRVISHTMLLAGKGVSEDGVSFLLFQDTIGGDVNNGDRGYLRFARYDPCPVVEFVRMSL